MKTEDYKRLLGEVDRLQAVVKERQDKREPFLGAFADALEHVVKKAKEWFNVEAQLADREISFLEELVPDQSYSEQKLYLTTYKTEFGTIASKFDKTIEEIRNGKVKRLKDFVREGLFQVVTRPEFFEDFEKMFNTCLNLEKLIDSLEYVARYLSSAKRISEITMEAQKKG
jgi:hypothetical protein